jgi:uncharacterized delta-60 repeat protein
MRLPSALGVAGFCVASLLAPSPAGSEAAARSGRLAVTAPSAQWRAEVQSAPGREVLAMRPQGNIPDMAALANGNIVVSGTAGAEHKVNGGHLAVAELLPNGRLDPGFGNGGVELTGVRLQPWQTIAMPDGRVLILGPNRAPGSQQPRVTRFPDWEVLRLLPDGRPDPSFGHAGFLEVSGVPVPSEGPGHSIAPELAPNGAILLPTVIGPLFTPTMTSGLVRLNPDGSRDASFGSAGVAQLPAPLEAFSVGSDGSTVAAVGEQSGALLLRLTAGGGLDPSFNGGSPVQLPLYRLDSLLLEPDGAAEMHGYPSSNSLIDTKIWRFTGSGAPDASWGSGGAVDLGPAYGYVNQLLPAGGGASLLVTMGLLTPSGAEAARVRILHLTSTGQIEPAAGAPSGLLTLPFGGGSYAPGRIADLHQNSFTPTGVIQRAGGTLLFNGSVEASEAFQTEGGPELVAGISGFALAVLDSSYRPDPAFTGVTRFRLAARVTSTRLTSNGIAVRLSSSHAAMSVVTVTAAGQIIARGTVPFFSMERTINVRTARIPLTRAGKRLLRRHRRFVNVAVRVAGADLAANHAAARTSARLAG